MTVKLYHRTQAESALAILREGFRDATGTYLTMTERSGVWLSDVPLDANEGPNGDTLLMVDVPDSVFEACAMNHEYAEAGKPYRELLVPAALIKRDVHVRVEEVDEEPDWLEVPAERRSAWKQLRARMTS